MREYEKLIRNGEVAVLIAPERSAGWSTWAQDDWVRDFLRFDRHLVAAVLAGQSADHIEAIARDLLGPEVYFYSSAAGELVIKWVKQGTPIAIVEREGVEILLTDEITTA